MTKPTDDLDALAREYARFMCKSFTMMDPAEAYKAGWTARGERDLSPKSCMCSIYEKSIASYQKTALDFQARYSGALDRLAKLEKVAECARKYTKFCKHIDHPEKDCGIYQCTETRQALAALDQDSAGGREK